MCGLVGVAGDVSGTWKDLFTELLLIDSVRGTHSTGAGFVGREKRAFELAVHTADLASALDVPLDIPATAAVQALELVSELAVIGGLAGPLLLATTGRQGLPAGYSVL